MTNAIISKIGTRMRLTIAGMVVGAAILAPMHSFANSSPAPSPFSGTSTFAPAASVVSSMACGDVNGSGRVGAVDLLAVISRYSQPKPDGGVFTVREILQVMHQNGASCSSS